MRIFGAAAAATLVTVMAMIGPQSAAKADLRNTFLRVDRGAQVSEGAIIEGHRALETTSTDVLAGCINGYPGIQSGNVCCSLQCEACGGVGCSLRPGGEDSCCTSNILDEGSSCNDVDSAPCFIEDEGMVPAPSPIDTETSASVCMNGYPGIQWGNVCCALECGLCGGVGCSTLPGGEDSCCTSNILEDGNSCNDVDSAPCFLEDGEPMSTCSNGLPGVQRDDVCCAVECETCGGYSCASRPGGTESCCMGTILEAGISCSDVDEGPCIIEDEPTPSPTMMPTVMMSTCSNGLPGVQRDNVCCAMECKTCGGYSCASRPGGSESCCMGTILDAGISCNDVDAGPCIIEEPTPSPTMMPTMVPTMPSPTIPPTMVPTMPSLIIPPTMMPTMVPTMPSLTIPPTMMPTMVPTMPSPTIPPTTTPTMVPTMPSLTIPPTLMPTMVPTMPSLTIPPTMMPTMVPTMPSLTIPPTMMPTMVPTMPSPTIPPTTVPTMPLPTIPPITMPTMAPTIMPTAPLNVSTCSNGYPGIQDGNVCCSIECGTCGGLNCSSLPGGSDSCCSTRVLADGSSCSEVDVAPCYIEEAEPTPSPTTTPVMPSMISTCSNGFFGYQDDHVCCAVECGLCGGVGCGTAPGGSDNCCSSTILTAGALCVDVGEAPCIIV